ncbi:MAG: hypothetical protein QNJ72_13655, partial [Pleurocapsa sp. MO_226.B13]|nr:hypothetical protein [Pleurocapsa sp. MO_226.B13]
MSKIKLLKPQKPTVKAWCDKHNGKVVQINDRSCRYRECIIEWNKEVFYPHLRKTAGCPSADLGEIVNYRTSARTNSHRENPQRNPPTAGSKILSNRTIL